MKSLSRIRSLPLEGPGVVAMQKVDVDIQDLADRLEKLSQEILLTVQDGLQFIALLEEYQTKFNSIQTNLIEIKSKIYDGEFTAQIEEDLNRNLRAMNQLTGPRIRNFIRNRFEMFQNFENDSRKQSEELTWKALKIRLIDFQDLLH